MCRTVGHVLGGHVEEVVAGLQVPPVLFEAAVVAEAYALGHAVELVDGLVLQLVAHPCRNIAGLVGVADGVHDNERVDGFELGDGIGGCPELYAALGGHAGQSLKELQDAGGGVEGAAEDLEVEADVDNLLLGRGCGNPVHILVGGKGVLVPRCVAEVAGDVLAELRVAQQHFQLGSRGGAVDVVGRLPAKDVLGAFGEDAFVAHGQDLRGNLVVVDHLGVAEHLGVVAQEGVELV